MPLSKELLVEYGRWNEEAPFGICPECSAQGDEIFPDKDSSFALFVCPKCKRYWNEKKTSLDWQRHDMARDVETKSFD